MTYRGGGNKKRTYPTTPITFSDQEGVELWDRQPNEDEAWYKRFLLYLNLEGLRTIRRAYQADVILKKGKYNNKNEPNTYWYIASKNYRWSERASAYDKHKFLEAEALKESRRFVVSEHEWEISQKLLEKAIELLPSVKGARLDAIVQAVNQASTLMRSSADMFDGDLNAAINVIKKAGFQVIDPMLNEEEYPDE
jgi:hypothetical protein